MQSLHCLLTCLVLSRLPPAGQDLCCGQPPWPCLPPQLLARQRIPSGAYSDPLSHIFDEFDQDRDGALTAAEVAAALRSRQVDITDEQAGELATPVACHTVLQRCRHAVPARRRHTRKAGGGGGSQCTASCRAIYRLAGFEVGRPIPASSSLMRVHGPGKPPCPLAILPAVDSPHLNLSTVQSAF